MDFFESVIPWIYSSIPMTFYSKIVNNVVIGHALKIINKNVMVDYVLFLSKWEQCKDTINQSFS